MHILYLDFDIIDKSICSSDNQSSLQIIFKDAQYIVVNCYTYEEYISDALATWINCIVDHYCTDNKNLSQIKKIFFIAKNASKDIGESDKKRLEKLYFSYGQSLLSIANLSITGIPSDNIEFTKIESIKTEKLEYN